MVRKLLGQPKILFLIFIVLALLMVSSALIELQQSKIELLSLMREQAHSLLESLIIASENTLSINDYLEANYKERLLNNANLIKTLYEKEKISDPFLAEICVKNNIYRINIFNRDGKKVNSSHPREHFDLPEKNTPSNILRPIFMGMVDTLIIGIKAARYKAGFRFTVAVSARDRSAIVLNLDAQELLEYRKKTGFGILLRKVIQNPGIVYAALQDTSSILAASGNVRQLEAIQQSEFLSRAHNDSLFLTRTAIFDTLEVFEAVHPFVHNDAKIGLFRLGISLDPVLAINARIYRRLIIISIVLIIFGSIMFTFIFIRQRYNLLRKQYQEVETYSSNIIHHVSDAIIVLDQKQGIKIFNTAAQHLFEKPVNNVLGKPLTQVFSDEHCHKILDNATTMQQIECSINQQKKQILVSRSTIRDSAASSIIILVIRDLTQQRKMEAQIQRKERLSAMGELASGVAHEIRNPLNTIGTIVQQLDKDFSAVDNDEEYHQLARLVYQEVRRINDTVQNFLKFSRPDPIQPDHFKLQELFDYLKKQYQTMLHEHKITMKMNLKWLGEVLWDRKQIQQVFMNLIQNSIDAMRRPGTIIITVKTVSEGELDIVFSDDGPGIDDDIRPKIFNLYYTTKAKGTGIGLSMVQRIIYDHGGVISVESTPGKGTAFIIRIPIAIQKRTASGTVESSHNN
jgi:signal transduction histidine kinase